MNLITPKSAVSRKIKQIRVLRNMTQEDVANLCDISVSYLSHIERGVRDIDTVLLGKISNALSCSVKDFFEPELKILSSDTKEGNSNSTSENSPVISEFRLGSDGKIEFSSLLYEKNPSDNLNGAWFIVQDESMSPKFMVGDMVYFDFLSKSEIDKRFCVVVLSNSIEHPIIRQIFIHGDNLLLSSPNSAIAPELLVTKKIKFIAPITHLKLKI